MRPHTLNRPEQVFGASPGGRGGWPAWAVPGLVTWAIVSIGLTYDRDTLLMGPDSYLRVVRVLGIIERGGWNGGWLAADGAPYGYALHWTMPLDLVVLALAAPFAPFLGWQEAAVLAAPAVGPVTGGLAVLAAAWAAAAFRQQDGAIAAAVLVATAPLLISYGFLGRADHHVLIVAGTLWTVGALARVLTRRDGLSGGTLAVAGALTLWTSLEGLPVVLAALAGAGVMATLRPQEYQRSILFLAAAFPTAVAVALALDRPYNLVEPDRLSLPHLVLSCLIAVVMLVPVAPPLQTRFRHRLALAALAAGLAGLGFTAAFPAALDPVTIRDPAVLSFVVERTRELQPVNTVAKFFLCLTPALLGAAALAWLAVRDWPGTQAQGWALACLALLAYAVEGALHTRVALPGSALGALACGIAWGRIAPSLRSATRLALFGLLVLLPSGLGLATHERDDQEAGKKEACALRQVLPSLRAAVGHGRPIILADFNLAPEILFHTSYRTVGSMYHRNEAGLRDGLAAFTSPPESQAALEVVRRRGVEWVLVCAESGLADDGSLWRRLADEQPPEWLRPVPLATAPPDQGTALKLYKVTLP